MKDKKIKVILEQTKKLVDPAIKELLTINVNERTQELVKYQINTGGKRLRPALTLISCRLLGGNEQDVLYPAAGVEILHNCLLIIDDIIDNSVLRRNEKTCWAKFGRSVAECIGADYAASVFQAARKSKRPSQVSRIFAKTLKITTEGELSDILFERSGREDEPYIKKERKEEITESDYLKMTEQKTASLLQASCKVGGICAEANKRQLERLEKYGFNLGMAFQIQDDLLDIFGEQDKLGKETSEDIKERKGGNIILLFALEELESDKKEKLRGIIRKKEYDKKETREAIKLIKETESKERAEQLGSDFISQAKDNLDSLPDNEWNKALKEIADFVIKRIK